MKPPLRIEMLYVETRVSTCRQCGEPIRWGKTKGGRPMPCEPDAAVQDGVWLDADQTHWPHCSGAAAARGTRRNDQVQEFPQ